MIFSSFRNVATYECWMRHQVVHKTTDKNEEINDINNSGLLCGNIFVKFVLDKWINLIAFSCVDIFWFPICWFGRLSHCSTNNQITSSKYCHIHFIANYAWFVGFCFEFCMWENQKPKATIFSIQNEYLYVSLVATVNHSPSNLFGYL